MDSMRRVGADRIQTGKFDLTIISITFDDAIDQHLDIAIPLLDEHGLNGTFYAHFYSHLTSSSLIRRRDEWRQAAKRGHELGNHTLFHPADARKEWVREGNALDLYTLDRMRLELQVANEWLAALDGRSTRTFAYPCSNSVLGSYGRVNRLLFKLRLRNTRWPGLIERMRLDFGNTRCSYESVMPEFFVAARGGGLHLPGESPAIESFNRYSLPSAAVEGHSFEEMRGFVTRSLARKSWPILQFHGVGGGHHMNCDRTEFKRLVVWLAEHHHDRVVTVEQGAQLLFEKQWCDYGTSDGTHALQKS
jgi:Polysaccharide deacetylase